MKPNVRRCVANGVIAISAEVDYQIAKAYYHPRAVLVGYESKSSIPGPLFCLFFTDSEQRRQELGSLYTGSIADCESLIADCVVRSGEFFIPKYDSYPRTRYIPVPLDAARALIEGKVAQVGMHRDALVEKAIGT